MPVTVLKSGNAYGGAASLSSIAKLTQTAQNIYDVYAARVVADGGTVFDAAGCLDVITRALIGDYFWRMAAAVSPNWGRKLVATDIAKLYSLRGTIDCIMLGSVPLDTTTNPKPLARLDGANEFTFAALPVLAAGADGLTVMPVVDGAGPVVIQTYFTSGQPWQINQGVANHEIVVNAVSKFVSNPEYTGQVRDASANMVEMGVQRMIGFANGLERKVITPAFDAIAAGATANVKVKAAGGSPRVGEWWFFNDTSGLQGVNAMMRASEDAGLRY